MPHGPCGLCRARSVRCARLIGRPGGRSRLMRAKVKPNHVLESLEQRQLLSGGGTDVALIDSTLPEFRTLRAAVPVGNKVITYDGHSESAAKVMRKLAAWAAANGTKIRSVSILSHGAAGRFKL